MTDKTEEIINAIKSMRLKEALVAEVISFAYMAKCGVKGINISKSKEVSMDGTSKKVFRIEVTE